MTTALLIIDVQQALCAGQWAAHDITAVIARLNAASAAARAAGVPVIFVQHQEGEGPMVAGSPGWQLAQGLDVAAGDLRVDKTTPNSFHRTPLQALLQERGVTHLVVGGLQTEYCVDTTVRQALALGYEVTLIADAHSTLDGAIPAPQIIAHHNHTLASMDSFGVRVRLQPAAQLAFGA